MAEGLQSPNAGASVEAGISTETADELRLRLLRSFVVSVGAAPSRSGDCEKFLGMGFLHRMKMASDYEGLTLSPGIKMLRPCLLAALGLDQQEALIVDALDCRHGCQLVGYPRQMALLRQVVGRGPG